MSDPRDLLKPVGLQPIGGGQSKSEEANTAPTSTPAPSTPGPGPLPAPSARPAALRTPPPPTPPPAAPPQASAYLQTAAPIPADNTPYNPVDNLRRIRQEEIANDNTPRIRMFALIGAGVVAVGIIAAFLFEKMPHPAASVSGYSTFTAADNSFMCETPRGWEQKATGEVAGQNLSSAENGLTISSGHTHIEISMSTVAGLAKGQLLFGSDITPGAMTGKGNASAVAGLQKKSVVRRFEGYKETREKSVDSEMAHTDSFKQIDKMNEAMAKTASENGGDAERLSSELKKISGDIEPDMRVYEFTAKEPWYNLGGKVHGYRAVFGGGAYIASVLCRCPDNEWAKVKPVFLHVMNSIQEVAPTGEPDEGEPEELAPPEGPTGVFTPPPG